MARSFCLCSHNAILELMEKRNNPFISCLYCVGFAGYTMPLRTTISFLQQQQQYQLRRKNNKIKAPIPKCDHNNLILFYFHRIASFVRMKVARTKKKKKKSHAYSFFIRSHSFCCLLQRQKHARARVKNEAYN